MQRGKKKKKGILRAAQVWSSRLTSCMSQFLGDGRMRSQAYTLRARLEDSWRRWMRGEFSNSNRRGMAANTPKYDMVPFL